MNPDDVPATDPSMDQVAALLDGVRPSPRERFRTALGQRLASQDPGFGPRPARLWPQALLIIAVGVVLLIAGALVSVGGL